MKHFYEKNKTKQWTTQRQQKKTRCCYGAEIHTAFFTTEYLLLLYFYVSLRSFDCQCSKSILNSLNHSCADIFALEYCSGYGLVFCNLAMQAVFSQQLYFQFCVKYCTSWKAPIDASASNNRGVARQVSQMEKFFTIFFFFLPSSLWLAKTV